MTISYRFDRTGLYQNLVEELLEKGHTITIVKTEKKNKYKKINSNLSVLDVKTGSPFEKNKFKKGFNLILLNKYFKNAIKKYLSKEKFDLILYETPPITLYETVKYCKNKYSAKTFLMLKDIFPQNAVDLEMIRKNGLIFKYFRNKEKKYYKYSDYIGCMSQGNIDFIKKHNSEIDINKLDIFPNSIKIEEVDATFNENKTVFMFGGNLGKPQNTPLLLKIAKELENYRKAEFIIIGNGTEVGKIEEFSKKYNLSNFKYMKELPQNEYEKILEKADVGVISLDSRFTIPNIPSRFQGYMKLKKPTLAIMDINTDLKDMIQDNNCGWWCDARDERKIIETIKLICENKEQQIEYGENGFKYLCKAFDVKENVRKIEEFMEN